MTMPTVGLSAETEAKLARSRLRWYRTTGIVGIITCLAVLYMLGTVVEQNSAAQRRDRVATAQRADSRAILRALVECTTPPEERHPPVKITDPSNDCYARSLRQQGKAVTDLSQYSIVAAACGAAHPGDTPATYRCSLVEIQRLRDLTNKEKP